MLQFKRFVAAGCVLMHLVSTGCASASYAGRAPAAEPTMIDAKIGAAMIQERASRSFESLASVAPGSIDEDMWSGGEVDNLQSKSPAREELPQPPPPPVRPAEPGSGGQNTSPTGPRPSDGNNKLDPTSTPPTTTGKKDEPARTEVASPMRAPMLIYTAQLNMGVYEVRNSLNEVETLAQSLGGFLAKRDERAITIRVPVSRFEDALRRIEKLGDMLTRNVDVEDVTEEFNDVEIRLKNARAVRDRLEQLLSKAAKVEESIQIERELERVALVIERLEGRMKFLRERAAYSTITVMFHARTAAELGKRPFNLPVPWLHEMGLGRLLSL